MVSESLDQPVGWSDRVAVKLHLMIGPSCRRFAQQLNILRRALTKLWSDDLEDAAYQSDERLTPDALERIRKALN